MVHLKNGKRKICYLGLSRWPDGPGDPRVFQKQLPALVAAGYAVTALVTGSDKPYDLYGVRIKPFPWEGGLWSRCCYLGDVYRKALAEKADCYFFGNFELLPVAALLKWQTGTRLVYDSMEHFPDMMRVSRQAPVAIRPVLAFGVDLVERVFRRSMDLIITADEPTMDRFRRTRPSAVIFNFPPLHLLDGYDPALLGDLRRRYAGRRVITYVGSMGWDRGLREMAETMVLIKAKAPDVVLTLLGGWQFAQWRSEYEQLLDRLGVRDVVELCGTIPQTQLGAYLRIADIGLALLEESPKHEKNIATKQFDYMCCSVPVVANNLRPFREFLGQARAGTIIDQYVPDQIAEACLKLLKNPELRREMGENGRRMVEQRWNWQSQAHKLREAFVRMMPPSEPTAAS